MILRFGPWVAEDAPEPLGRPPRELSAAPPGGKVIDLMSALESSAAAREARGEPEVTVTELKSGENEKSSKRSAGSGGPGGAKGSVSGERAAKKTAKSSAGGSAKKVQLGAFGYDEAVRAGQTIKHQEDREP